jgi:hypothetical protein
VDDDEVDLAHSPHVTRARGAAAGRSVSPKKSPARGGATGD